MGTAGTSVEQPSSTTGGRCAVRLAPWGSPPTPLLPWWYRELLSKWQLPDDIRRRCAAISTVGEIGAFWDTAQSPLDHAALRSLVDLIRGIPPPVDHVILPAGIDRSELSRCPLRPRTMNALGRYGMLEGHDALIVGQLLSLRNFGIASLLDVMCVTELALARRALHVTSNADDSGTEESTSVSGAWGNCVDLLEALISAASEFRGAVTVGDALRMDLAHLASAIGIAPALESLEIRELASERPIADVVCERLATILASTSPVEQLVLDKRLFVSRPLTLRETGTEVGVTGERIRRIQVQVKATVDEAVGPEIATASILLAERLGPVVSASELESVVVETFDDESSTAEAADLARRILGSALGYSCINGVCLDQSANEVVVTLRSAAKEIADDVGLIDEGALLDHLPSAAWNDFFPQLLERCEFHRIGGRFALRNTAKARAKAALLDIGRVATKEEIAEVSGLGPDRVGGQLSAIASVARADKTRWGLAEWIDDVYEGIPAEIIQRINEDGGATSVERLLEELPRLFGVSESSVRSYIGTSQFTFRDGYVSLADRSSVTLRDLNDVIDGRDGNGNPYWTFPVENRYFDGYSLVGFPPELARELGCAPNGKIRAHVDHPAGCRDLSVIWRLASPTGASLGYLAEPLRQLGVSAGDRVRVVIMGAGVIELCRDNVTDVSVSNAAASAESLLERMKNRRKVV